MFMWLGFPLNSSRQGLATANIKIWYLTTKILNASATCQIKRKQFVQALSGMWDSKVKAMTYWYWWIGLTDFLNGLWTSNWKFRQLQCLNINKYLVQQLSCSYLHLQLLWVCDGPIWACLASDFVLLALSFMIYPTRRRHSLISSDPIRHHPTLSPIQQTNNMQHPYGCDEIGYHTSRIIWYWCWMWKGFKNDRRNSGGTLRQKFNLIDI